MYKSSYSVRDTLSTIAMVLFSLALVAMVLVLMSAILGAIWFAMFGSLALLGVKGSMILWGVIGLCALTYGIFFSKDCEPLRKFISGK
jgi:hypothetical protein